MVKGGEAVMFNYCPAGFYIFSELCAFAEVVPEKCAFRTRQSN